MKRRSSLLKLTLVLLLCAPLRLCAKDNDSRPELIAQTGHAFMVWKLAFSSDSKLLASASFGESQVVLWDVENQRELRTFLVPAASGSSFLNGVHKLVFSNDGNLLAAATEGAVIVWRITDGKELYHFIPSAQGLSANLGISGLAFSPVGRYLAAITGSSIQIWEMSGGNLARSIPQQTLAISSDIAFSPDERSLAAATYGDGSSGSVQVFDLSSGNVQQHSFEGHPLLFSNRSIVYNAAGHLLVLSSDDDSKTQAEEIFLNDVTAGSKATITKLDNVKGTQAASLSPSGALIAISDATVTRIFDANTHRERRSFSDSSKSAIPGGLTVAAFSADEKLVATTLQDGRINIWESNSGELKKTLSGHANFATAAVFAKDGNRLLTGAKTQWDLNSGIGLRATAETTLPFAIASPDGRLLAMFSFSSLSTQLWDTAQQKSLHALQSPANTLPNKLAFSPDGSLLAINYREDFNNPAVLKAYGERNRRLAGNSAKSVLRDPTQYMKTIEAQRAEEPGAQITLWNTQSGSQITILKGHTSDVGAFTFTPDGKKLISVARTEMRIWEMPSGKLLNTYQSEAAPQTPQSPYSALLGGMAGVVLPMSVAVSPDGETVIVAEKKMVNEAQIAAMNAMLAQMATLRQSAPQRRSRFGGLIGNPLPSFGKKSQPARPATPDMSAAINSGFHIEGPLQVMNLANGELAGTLPGHSSGADSVAFSADGKLLASGGEDHVIRIWSMADGSLVHELTGDVSTVNSLSFSPDGRLLVSSAYDGATRLWDVSTGQQLATLFSINDGSDWLVVTPQGLFDGSPAAWDQILWRYGNNTFNVFPVEVFFNEYFYPGLLADIYAGKRPVPAVEIARKDRRQPEVALTTERADANARTANLTLHVHEVPPDKENQRGSGAKDLRLFRNGSLVKVWHGDLLHGRSETTINLAVPIIAGENRLTAYAFNNDNVKSRDAISVIQGADSLRHSATTYVLAVGVNDYANSDYNLKFAVPDAQSFATTLKQEQERLPEKPNVEVRLLLNQDATRSNILQAISQIGQRVRPEDHVILFFASHGTAAKNSFYIIPHDIGYTGGREQLDEAAVGSILAHSISDRNLEEALEGIDAAQIIVVIDACNSGQALEAEEKRRGPMNSKGLAQLAYEKGMYVLTASQSYQAALEASQFGHGLLTYALVEEGLTKDEADSEPQDGKIVIREWLDYSTRRVPEIQIEKLQQARELRHTLSFGEAGKAHAGLSQYPKVFYRRELESNPWLVAATTTKR
jgi:WD40 repeat protein